MKWSPQQDAALVEIDAWLRDSTGPQIFRLGGYAGTGKCLGFGTPVMKSDGTIVPVQDIVVGDKLMGPDSMPREVRALGRGAGPLYRIVPVKGDPWICNDVHVMTLAGSQHKHYIGKTIDVPLNEHLKEWHFDPGRRWKLLRAAVEFPAADLPFDPYLLGVWLGDGTTNQPQITTPDQQIVDYCEAYAASIDLRITKVWHDANNVWSLRLCGLSRQIGANPLVPFFRTMVTEEGRKFIRPDYLRSSREQRMRLLAGLIDTDGFVSSGSCDYVTISKSLFDDILYLARSLGFAAYGGPCQKGIKSIGFVGTYYRISISGDLSQLPCIVPRRQAPPRKQVKRVNVTGWKAEPIGDGCFYGFELDGDGRFLLGDFTVTHNTTIAKTAVGNAPGTVHFLAPTGKAADVLTRKGCPTRTIHSAAYLPKGEKRSERAQQLREELRKLQTQMPVDEERIRKVRKTLREASRNDGPIFQFDEASDLGKEEVACLVIDEGSMVNDDMRCDLLTYGKKILVLYDPFQLPPVRGAGGFTHGQPDILLTEIHRQAAESGILRFATAVREGKPLPLGAWGEDCTVVKHGDANFDHQGAAMSADMIICGKNETRLTLNRRVRELRGLTSPHPQVGDRVVCKRNEYDGEPVLLNGSTWNVTHVDEADTEEMLIWMGLVSADVPGLEAWTQSLLHLFHGWDDVPAYMARNGTKFTFGHAITAHSGQGSEWPNVYVVDESARAFPAFPARHLYTAATRAREKLVVVRP